MPTARSYTLLADATLKQAHDLFTEHLTTEDETRNVADVLADVDVKLGRIADALEQIAKRLTYMA